jgi:hypothetical protein
VYYNVYDVCVRCAHVIGFSKVYSCTVRSYLENIIQIHTIYGLLKYEIYHENIVVLCCGIAIIQSRRTAIITIIASSPGAPDYYDSASRLINANGFRVFSRNVFLSNFMVITAIQ